MFVAILLTLLMSTVPATSPPIKACYTIDEIAVVFNYKAHDKVFIWSHIFKDAFERPSPYRWADFYDPKTKMFYFIPITNDGCLHPEGVRVVTPYDYSYVTESAYA